MPTSPEQADLVAKRGAPATVIRALAKHHEVQSAHLAAMIGVDRSSMSSKLTARREFRHEELYVIAQFFGVPLELLYGSKEDAIRYVLDHPESRPFGDLRSRSWARRTSGPRKSHPERRLRDRRRPVQLVIFGSETRAA